MAALSAVVGVIGSVVSAAGAIQQGQAQNQAAQFEADQQEMQGREEFAAAQREADQARQEAEMVESRQQALAASSGGAAADPTIVRLMTDTAQQGEMNAQTALYGGENRKRGLFDQAMGTRMSGRAALTGSYLGAAGALASGFGKFFSSQPSGGTGSYG